MIKGKNVVLRALEPTDVDLLYQWENDQKLWHLSNTLAPFSRFILEQYVLNSEQDIFTAKQLRLMIDKISDQKSTPIGTIDLFEFDPHNRRAGIGIFIVRNHREHGFASEALQLVIDYCFQTLQLHQVYCNISEDNEISLKLFQKQRFKIIGKKKDWLLLKNRWMDEYILQLIND
ncbi:MAG: GNAT family N-acetyltransferase [Bacteroidales bacterium]|nr:GNAT family N-acetyltransferase [Bacteroidales bacterium]